jgi:hypothetical protein
VRHPGACHLYVHATESTVVPERATACAEFLGRSIPGASHINHMPSHTWNEVGRWGDSVRANIDAWHSDLKAAVGEGFAIYPQHNLHMLLYAASMDGQGAIAMQAGKDYAKLTGSTFYQVLTLLRFGRFDEVLARCGAADRGGHETVGLGYARQQVGRDADGGVLQQIAKNRAPTPAQNGALIGVRSRIRTRFQAGPQHVGCIVRKQQQDVVERPVEDAVSGKRRHRIAFLAGRRDRQDLRRVRRFLRDEESADIAAVNRLGKDQ